MHCEVELSELYECAKKQSVSLGFELQWAGAKNESRIQVRSKEEVYTMQHFAGCG